MVPGFQIRLWTHVKENQVRGKKNAETPVDAIFVECLYLGCRLREIISRFLSYFWLVGSMGIRNSGFSWEFGHGDFYCFFRAQILNYSQTHKFPN